MASHILFSTKILALLILCELEDLRNPQLTTIVSKLCFGQLGPGYYRWNIVVVYQINYLLLIS